ncbi:MAG: hypothetical protein L6R39_001547 [Caloplaca ligustica]|nr:MAG: hypothetical protein L6R39_001547 [Caloplaca ligustica]
MSEQYNAIVEPYNEMRKLPGEVVETYNVQQALAPCIRGAKVLDLACGAGHYSHLMIAWGASHVIGADISSGMIAAAKTGSSSDQMRFIVADCSISTQYENGPFDIVFGGWLLNYAPDKGTMVNMFRNISTNLKEGGLFFGVAPYPTEDPRRHNERGLRLKPLFWDQLWIEPTADVEDGVATRVTADTRPEKIQFDNFHLRGSVYEEAAKEGGMNGKFEWKPIIMPPEESQLFQRKDNWETELAEYMKTPHFVVITVAKS